MRQIHLLIAILLPLYLAPKAISSEEHVIQEGKSYRIEGVRIAVKKTHSHFLVWTGYERNARRVARRPGLKQTGTHKTPILTRNGSEFYIMDTIVGAGKLKLRVE